MDTTMHKVLIDLMLLQLQRRLAQNREAARKSRLRKKVHKVTLVITKSMLRCTERSLGPSYLICLLPSRLMFSSSKQVA